ncbi:GNAT family N-acetyltransferase [Leifsonia shinshuensis]|uniref:GNAT family N-acetyltransferase n=1 Tax=Leifsonia shinshuensis TaxID=150026 RepID=UPI002864F590|nr:GNAT family N-acetyltransferase [Leifsonia shinshuensis]MDR6970224.1 GNAT superfamily N-acetyltransferase [Leifsonia shinshuensis]
MRVTRLHIPDALGTRESAAFEELVGVLNGIVVDLWGDDDFVETAEQALAAHREQDYVERIVHVAVEEGAIVGRVEAIFPLEEDSETVSLLVDVAPALRGRGIGTALLEKGEELAAEGGRRVISTYTEHPVRTLEGADRLVRAPAGTAGLPRESPHVRFALKHGYTLGQIERSSELHLPLPPEREAGLTMTLNGFRLVSWWGAAPDDLLERFAAMKARMSTDIPQTGIAVDPEDWDGERVRSQERTLVARGEPLLVTAAVHEETGEIAAYTELAVPADGTKAEQYDTLVARAHRGHRLGTAVKLRNIQELGRRAPHIRRILTWNADENDPMLAINRAFGFRPHALTGHWQKTLE